MSPGLLRIDDLTVRRGPCPVVDRVSLQVAPGEVLALLGPNGAGKSSLLKAALGLLPVAGGSLHLGDEDITRLDPLERARRLAYVPQRSRLAAALSAENVVAAGRFAHRSPLARLSPADSTAVEDALRLADAAHLAGRPFTALSAGEQQRVLLARALATGSGCLLLDEPTSALDIGHALALLALLRSLAAQGRAVLIVLHQLEEARQVADRCVLMDRGRAVAQGRCAGLLAGPEVRQVFGVEAVQEGAWAWRRADGP